MSYYSRKINKIQQCLARNMNPPKFEPNKWKRVKINCYGYALDIPISDWKEEIWFPGCICSEKTDADIWSSEELIERVKRDLNFLGISYRENEGELKEGEYRLAIYQLPSYHDCPIDFHFSRQDLDGVWSEKASWNAKIKREEEKSDIPPDLEKYGPILVGILIISK